MPGRLASRRVPRQLVTSHQVKKNLPLSQAPRVGPRRPTPRFSSRLQAAASPTGLATPRDAPAAPEHPIVPIVIVPALA